MLYCPSMDSCESRLRESYMFDTVIGHIAEKNILE